MNVYGRMQIKISNTYRDGGGQLQSYVDLHTKEYKLFQSIYIRRLLDVTAGFLGYNKRTLILS